MAAGIFVTAYDGGRGQRAARCLWRMHAWQERVPGNWSGLAVSPPAVCSQEVESIERPQGGEQMLHVHQDSKQKGTQEVVPLLDEGDGPHQNACRPSFLSGELWHADSPADSCEHHAVTHAGWTLH